jgi:hypothetical protein
VFGKILFDPTTLGAGKTRVREACPAKRRERVDGSVLLLSNERRVELVSTDWIAADGSADRFSCETSGFG